MENERRHRPKSVRADGGEARKRERERFRLAVMDQEKRTREATVAEGRQEMGEGRGTTESGQCVILRRLRKTRRPPARFASDEDLKIEGRRMMAEGRMPIAPSATLFSIRPSLCL